MREQRTNPLLDLPKRRRPQRKRLLYRRAGPGCLDSAPRKLSGFLPGYTECGALRFCRCVGRA
ncbi:hypothetical protein E4K64_37935 [Bradyrhizobium frederickii]|uniref:Uncharacterized protein n=1 Tax=Bradyrhizobium frederickii TaxID=2560054 RepID=A0A4Y9NLS1_9BRAD|nr:hypothetical protein E4K64_37935 [Bradyrhizobium frederickii]